MSLRCGSASVSFMPLLYEKPYALVWHLLPFLTKDQRRKARETFDQRNAFFLCVFTNIEVNGVCLFWVGVGRLWGGFCLAVVILCHHFLDLNVFVLFLETFTHSTPADEK